MRYKSMDEIPNSRIHMKARSAPVGYAAMTSVSIGGLTVPALLDSGASTSAIPEEVFLAILEAADNREKAGSARHAVAQRHGLQHHPISPAESGEPLLRCADVVYHHLARGQAAY